MSGLFSSAPKPQAPPAAPTVDDAAKARSEADAMARRKGRVATMFAGKKGGLGAQGGTGGGAAKALMGG